jgi:hypothetical protein
METSDSKSPPAPKISSDKLVDTIMQKGFEDILVKTTAGFVMGGLVGIVLARGGGGASGARRAWAGLGAGIGLGSGWARTSIELEKIVGSKEE